MIWIIIYIISAFLMWNYMRLIFRYDGLNDSLKPGIKEMIITFVPIINTIALLAYLVDWPTKNIYLEDKYDSFYMKFFKVRK